MDEPALDGMTGPQFANSGLLRLGVGQEITRIVRNIWPRRNAPTDEVLKLRPDLKPPGCRPLVPLIVSNQAHVLRI